MIWAAISGVPCLRSWPLMASTLSLFLNFPSLAAKPPDRRSRMKTPLSSDLRMSLMPNGSLRWLLISVTCKTVLWLWLEVALPWALWKGCEAVVVVDEEGWRSDRGSRDLKPFSCITVSLRREGCRSTAMARVCGTEAKLMSFTWKHHREAKQKQQHSQRSTQIQKNTNLALHSACVRWHHGKLSIKQTFYQLFCILNCITSHPPAYRYLKKLLLKFHILKAGFFLSLPGLRFVGFRGKYTFWRTHWSRCARAKAEIVQYQLILQQYHVPGEPEGRNVRRRRKTL